MPEMNKILKKDAFQLLSELPDKSIDMVITDPPWLTTSLDFDKQDLNFVNLFKEYKRVMKDDGWFFLVGTVEMAFAALQAGFKRKFEYIWYKDISVSQTKTAVHPLLKHELIFAFYKPELKKVSSLTFNRKALRTYGHKKYKIQKSSTRKSGEFGSKNGRDVVDKNGNLQNYYKENNGYREGNSILKIYSKQNMPKEERVDHPTQKPMKLLNLLIRGYSNEGDVLLDTFSGSGVFAESAILNKRNFYSCDISEKYVKIGNVRVTKSKLKKKKKVFGGYEYA